MKNNLEKQFIVMNKFERFTMMGRYSQFTLKIKRLHLESDNKQKLTEHKHVVGENIESVEERKMAATQH
ncbi:CLUMA_CG007289, isoform A [Clunio marinus]|uniref:CLUMA_CG007289, isoform A n=1 Tax=Clunio marinus TaxID=568069 RepID=A0A1J1I5V2_9DIPT|nr:CLUMA_CG007289, isoform A [Clunio marinus]